MKTSVDPVVGECFFWSRTPGGFDSWDSAFDAVIIFTVNTLPPCPSTPSSPPVVNVTETAWEVFRSFALAAPSIGLEPAEHGITGLPTYLASPAPAVIGHTETLPDGRVLELEARVTGLTVDWGDGATSHHAAAEAAVWPDGSVTHTYELKTCSAEYRVSAQSGVKCHPTLEAYSIAASYRWSGRYRVDGGWVDLGTIDRASTVAYDVDEVLGILNP